MSAGIALTVVGGFLGAGKTTLLNRILTGARRVRWAVMVNDFGELAVDPALVTAHGGDTISFANGCVCCTLGDSLMLSLDRLLERPQPPEQILVEASGVADPAAIADIAALEPRLRRDLTIVLADAETIRSRAADPLLGDTVERQLRSADLVLLNKCDLVEDTARAQTRAWLAGACRAAVLETEHARIPMALLAADARAAGPSGPEPPRARPSGEREAHPFRTAILELDAPVDLQALRRGLSALPRAVIRAKGFVRSADPPHAHFLVQLTGKRVDITEWRGEGALPARWGLVLIGTRDMPDIDPRRLLRASAP